ncbi:hypothetical protein ACQP1V_36215 [Microtetraspora malaysiensis]|uniref:hypothetical protein n=1 Tax=Microtetraspora malaysiensis TaxID=161358 RepID=UPI003D8CC4AE
MADPVAPADGAYINKALWDAEVTGRWSDLYSPWAGYTPSWSAATTAPVLGNGTLTGAFIQISRTVHLRLRLVIGSSTNAGAGAWSFSLPTNHVLTAIQTIGGFVSNSAGSVRWPVSGYLSNAGGIERLGTLNNILGPAAPFSWASNDQLVLTGSYEITG